LLPGADAVYDKRYAVNEIHFESQYYQPITSRWILVPRINAQAVQSDVYFDDQLIRFGGALSMRGFREEQFRANRLVWTDIEGRFLLDRFSYVFLFGATGYFSAPDQQGIPFSTIQSTVLNSAGFGLSYRIPLGMLQFSYAVSTQSSLSNGMVHFGIINSF
jgi:hemolysin activation/secretion protein